MKLSRIFEPSDYYPASGEIILNCYPHNKSAMNLFSELLFNEREKFELLVNDLIAHEEATLKVNNIEIIFQISKRCLTISYIFEDDTSVSDMVIYDSLFNNNDPQTELFLALVKAACNAQLSKKSHQIILYNYPATAMYLNPGETLPIKEKLRALLKHPFFLRFR
jgi:hypothetical protein